MRLYLDTAYESDWAKGRWAEISRQWQAGGHLSLGASANEADAILVTIADPKGSYADTIEGIASSTSYRSTPNKLFVFDAQPNPVGLFPGLYCSLRRHLFSPSRHRTTSYMQSLNECVRADNPENPTRLRYLFSFQGNLTSSTRGRLLSTDFGRDDVLVERTASFWANTSGEEFRHFKQQYADNILQSKFILCPRGISVSSFRLFEAMQSGRVPIIISDAWVPPRSIDWASCSLRISDRDIPQLPEICLAHEHRWESMARAARATWEEWFSPAGLGRLIKTNLQDISRSRRFSERLHRAEWPIRRAVVKLRRTLIRTALTLKKLGGGDQ